MKASLSLSFVAVALAVASCGGSPTLQSSSGQANDLTNDHLQGEVKSVRQRVFWALEKFGRMDKGKRQNLKSQDYLRLYDDKGFLVEETFFDARDSVLTRRTLTYDKPGQLIKEELYGGSKRLSSVRYTYANGKLQQKETLDADGKQKERTTYVYYDTGLPMDEDKYNADNQLSQKIVCVYDGQNRLTEKQYYWGGGSPYKKEVLEYAGDGEFADVLITTSKYQNKEPVTEKKQTCSYTAQGYDKLRTTYSLEEEIAVEYSEYDYDSYGNLTWWEVRKQKAAKAKENATAAEEKATEEETDSADADSAELEDADVDSSLYSEEAAQWTASGMSYEYAYDEKNNWTQKITYKNENGEKKRQFYYERIVEYY